MKSFRVPSIAVSNPKISFAQDSNITFELRNKRFDLGGSLDLGESLALLESALGLEAHDLEAVKVGEALALGELSALLGPVGLLPLGVNLGLLPLLLEGGVAGATDETGDDEGREEALVERDGLSGDNKAVI